LFEDGRFVKEERLGEVDWFVVLNDLNKRGRWEPVFAEETVVGVRRCEECARLGFFGGRLKSRMSFGENPYTCTRLRRRLLTVSFLI
jgi:hypothetical protein